MSIQECIENTRLSRLGKRNLYTMMHNLSYRGIMELFIFAGPNGSGKSTVLSEFIEKFNLKDFEYINPDIYAKEFFSGIDDEIKRYQAAFSFAEHKRAKALEENKRIIIETVNSTTNKFDFYSECAQRNYKITVVYIATSDPKINMERIAIRKAQGGHDVLEEKIISRYYKSLGFLFNLSLFANVLYIYDNSETNKLKLCFYKDNQSKFTAKVIPQWVKKYYFEPLKNSIVQSGT